MVVLSTVFFIAAVCLVLALTRAGVKISHDSITAGATIACFAFAIQSYTVLSSFNLKWGEPFETILFYMSFLTFNLDVMRYECVMGTNAALHYAGTVLVFPTGCVLYIAIFLVMKFSFLKEKAQFDQLINGLGMISLALYASIAIVAGHPFMCFEHPSWYRDEQHSSVFRYPEVLCNSPEHMPLVGIGVLDVCCFVILLFVLACYITYQLPTRRDVAFATRYRFFFGRFTPDRYYFGLLFLSRSLTLSFVPIMFSSQGPRLLVLLLLLCGYTVAQLLLWPWRGKLTNFVDLLVSVSLISTAIVGCLLTAPSDDVRNVAQMVLVTSFFAMMLTCIGFLGRAAMRSMAGRKKEFKYFLSHHPPHGAIR
jgi:hypothetical protein